MTDSRIVQIIAAEGWIAAFRTSGGSTIIDGERNRVVAFGLREDGHVVPLVATGRGIIDATHLTTFEHITYSRG